MTRKKFVKQIMALGFSRNGANNMASKCRAAGEQYAAYYLRHRSWWRLAYAARKARAAVLNLSMAFSGLNKAGLLVHHVQPITPDNLEGGKVYLVTKQEHDRLHGYSANVSYVDEIHGQGGGDHE